MTEASEGTRGATSHANATSRSGAWLDAAKAHAPGLALALTVAAAAGFVSDHYGAPVMLMALLIGMAFNHLATAPATGPGIELAARTVLRVGIVLLGARITLAQIGSLGFEAVAMVCAFTALTIGPGLALAPLLGRRARFGLLSAGAVAICGASAALALSAVIPRRANDGEFERDTLFVVIAVTAFSTVAMVAYPIVFASLGFKDVETGFLLGATIHDVAQVVGAGFSVSDEAGETATITKLLRVTLLPVVLVIVLLAGRRMGGGGDAGVVSFPLFVVGFVVLAALNSAGAVPPSVGEWLSTASRLCLITAIAALGVKTSLKAMAEVGGRHIGLVVAETMVLLALALTALVMLRPFG